MRTNAYPSVRLAAALALASACGAHELKDVSLIASGGRAHLKLAFAPGPDEGDFPLYFQKADSSKGALTISFLETGTGFPLGRHALDDNAPDLGEITLKKVTSPSGKNFLGVELRLRGAAMDIIAAGEAQVVTAPKGVLKIQLGASPVPKYEWSLAKALLAGDAYLSAKAAPAPKPAGNAEAKAKAEERAAAEAFSAPVPSEPASPPPPVEPAVASGRARPSAESPAAPDPEPQALAPKPSSAKPRPPAGEPPAAQAPEAADPVTSAHADGLALEKKRGGAGGGGSGGQAPAKGTLSSSRVFVLGQGGKTLVLLKDSASLRTEAGAEGKVIKKIPIGEKVERLESKWGKVRVAAGQDTGWIRATEAVYADELTEAHEKAIQSRIDANRARTEAELARLAAIQAREEEKKAKAEEKKRKADSAAAFAAAEAQRKLAEKQAALEAKRQAAAAAANPAAGVREAGAAPDRAGQAAVAAGGAPGAPAAQGQGATQAAPRLGLADNPELANKLAQEKLAAEEEKKRIEPEENRVTYNSYGRRDPFIPVEQGSADNGIDIDQMKVVGIIWQGQPMAVLEHSREAGVSFTVKEGDPVHNGRVARISHDAVTFDISEYGISRSYSLKLVSSKEGAKK